MVLFYGWNMFRELLQMIFLLNSRRIFSIHIVYVSEVKAINLLAFTAKKKYTVLYIGTKNVIRKFYVEIFPDIFLNKDL